MSIARSIYVTIKFGGSGYFSFFKVLDDNVHIVFMQYI
jgi:hypothetical protein